LTYLSEKNIKNNSKEQPKEIENGIEYFTPIEYDAIYAIKVIENEYTIFFLGLKL
jgi:hypothetical protein